MSAFRLIRYFSKTFPFRIGGPVLLLGAIFLLSCFQTRNYLEPDAPVFQSSYSRGMPRSRDTITVVTFNLKYGEHFREAAREFLRFPQLRGADIILLQEMNEQSTDSLARRLGWNYVYFPATVHPGSHRNFGNAILSPWPIREAHKILLPHRAPIGHTRRIAVSAVVKIGSLPVLTFCVHTATILSPSSRRLAQADSLLKALPEEYPFVVVGGDFNTITSRSRQQLVALFRQNGFQEATREVESTAHFLVFKSPLDHIFVKGFRVLSAGVVRESRSSDHYPVWVRLAQLPAN